MSITSDLIRGHTETIILAQLYNDDSYGYEINKAIQQKTDGEYELKEATLYSAFRRLEQAGYINSYWGDENTGARRRYYKISEAGKSKYQDLLQEGKTEDAAYNIAIAGIGDISSLIYDMDITKKDLSEAGKQKSAAFTSIAVMAYIFSLIPIIVSLNDGKFFYGLAGFLMMVTLATGLLIYNNLTKQQYYRTEETMVAEFKEWQVKKSNRKLLRVSISFALWSITWIIFLIGLAIEALINIFFIMKK